MMTATVVYGSSATSGDFLGRSGGGGASVKAMLLIYLGASFATCLGHNDRHVIRSLRSLRTRGRGDGRDIGNRPGARARSGGGRRGCRRKRAPRAAGQRRGGKKRKARAQ